MLKLIARSSAVRPSRLRRSASAPCASSARTQVPNRTWPRESRSVAVIHRLICVCVRLRRSTIDSKPFSLATCKGAGSVGLPSSCGPVGGLHARYVGAGRAEHVDDLSRAAGARASGVRPWARGLARLISALASHRAACASFVSLRDNPLHTDEEGSPDWCRGYSGPHSA